MIHNYTILLYFKLLRKLGFFLYRGLFILPTNILKNDSSFFGGFFFDWFTFSVDVDLFGIILVWLAYVVGFIALLVIRNWINVDRGLFVLFFSSFVFFVFLFVLTTNLIVFFIAYECLLLPAFLIVYYTSPARRALQASVYFVVWTQIGSFIVFTVLLYLVIVCGCYSFDSLVFYQFSSLELLFLFLFLFIGFGVKAPIWPFHFWLTKTHVEAASWFSIYLSGFLVKTAIYGFYKLTSTLPYCVNVNFFITILIIGVLDASFKFWGQMDLKKLIAYATVQEMNMLFLFLLAGGLLGIKFTLFFCVMHAFLSSVMFFLVDCLYVRLHTRFITEVQGLLLSSPIYASSVFCMCLFFCGLPGSFKFVCEFWFFSSFYSITPSVTIFIAFVIYFFGCIGFCKNWYTALFGLQKNELVINTDLQIVELCIIGFVYFVMFFGGLLCIFLV